MSDLVQSLRDYCCAGFPYVCTGKMEVHKDGSVSCECGLSMNVVKTKDKQE